MTKQFLLMLCFLSSTYALNDECEACTLQVESAIQGLGNILKKIEPILITECQPCKSCEISGVSKLNLTTNTDVCTETIDGKKHHTMYVTFEKVNFNCVCELECDPSKLPERISKGFESLTSMECSKSKSAAGTNGYGGQIKRMGMNKMTGLKECRPKSSSSGSGSGSISVGFGGNSKDSSIGGSFGSSNKKEKKKEECPNGTTTGKVYVEWPNFDVSFATVTKKGSQNVDIGPAIVRSTNLKDIRVKCTGDDPNFEASCRCLIATDFHIVLITKAVEMMLPCHVEPQISKYDKILQYFKCEETDY